MAKPMRYKQTFVVQWNDTNEWVDTQFVFSTRAEAERKAKLLGLGLARLPPTYRVKARRVERPNAVDCYIRQFSNGSLIAIFPGLQASNHPYHCVSYELVGQHGACDGPGVMQQTSCVSIANAQAGERFEKHLRALGYDLEVHKKSHKSHYWYNH